MPSSCCVEAGKLISCPIPCEDEPEQLTELELQQALTIQAVIPEFEFKRLQLLLQAFTHKSYASSYRTTVGNNERLEFLGDSVLSFVVSEHIVRTYYVSEGVLSELRLLLCSNETLTAIGRSLGLDQHIRRSIGDVKRGGPTDRQVAGAVEALIGAIHLDSGVESARQLIARYILPRLPELIKSRDKSTDGLDPKSALQKLSQARLGIIPSYSVLAWGGKYPNARTTVAVMLGSQELARASGKNKKVASKAAAELGLKVLRDER